MLGFFEPWVGKMVSVSVNIDVVYIMQTLGGCVSVEVHIDIVIIMATIGEVCVPMCVLQIVYSILYCILQTLNMFHVSYCTLNFLEYGIPTVNANFEYCTAWILYTTMAPTGAHQHSPKWTV